MPAAMFSTKQERIAHANKRRITIRRRMLTGIAVLVATVEALGCLSPRSLVYIDPQYPDAPIYTYLIEVPHHDSFLKEMSVRDAITYQVENKGCRAYKSSTP